MSYPRLSVLQVNTLWMKRSGAYNGKMPNGLCSQTWLYKIEPLFLPRLEYERVVLFEALR